jgi:diaminohydroxyphosphoribosylaminopyrimidine deaminase/5-amino-6-(5-phosphoribosylamino)uracil reductase
VCGRAGIPLDCQLVRTACDVPLLVAHARGEAPEQAEALEAAGCRLMAIAPTEEGLVEPGALLDRLGDMDMTHVLVEGGGELLGGLFDAGLVDRAVVFVAPRVAGGQAAVTPVGGHGVATIDQAGMLNEWDWRRSGDDLLCQGWLSDPMDWAR